MIIESAALLTGYPAVLAGVGLRDLARRGYFDGVAPTARAELLAAIADIERAGRRWQVSREAAGNMETPQPEISPDSAISAERAAILLGVTSRRVRQLAPILGGSKTRGRWMFDRSAVLAEHQRRKAA